VIDLQNRVNTKIDIKYVNRRGTHVGKTRPYNGRIVSTNDSP